MPRIKASFENEEGQTLAGLLETPEGETRTYALFTRYKKAISGWHKHMLRHRTFFETGQSAPGLSLSHR